METFQTDDEDQAARRTRETVDERRAFGDPADPGWPDGIVLVAETHAAADRAWEGFLRRLRERGEIS